MKTKNNAIDKKQLLLQWLDAPPDAGGRGVQVLRYLLKLAWVISQQFKNNYLTLHSGALTYTIILSLVPMLAMSTALVKGLGGGDQLRETAYSYIDTLESSSNFQIPGLGPEDAEEASQTEKEIEGVTSHLRSAVDTIFDYVDNTNFATLGSFGVIGIFISVLLVLNHIEAAMNTIWKVDSGRSLLRKIADYICLMILLPLSINLAFAASAFLQSPVLSMKMDVYIPVDWLQTLVLQLLPVGFITLSFYVMFIFFPNTKVKTLPALCGAAFAGFCWFAVQNLYINLQVGVAKYNAIYGSFATVPLFLIWIYLGWLFILLGAQIAYALQNSASFKVIPQNEKPSMELSAALDIMERVYQSFDSREKIHRKDLGHALPCYPQSLITMVSDALIAADMLHLSAEEEAIMPTLPQKHYSKEQLVRLILGQDAPETGGGATSLTAIEAAGRACS